MGPAFTGPCCGRACGLGRGSWAAGTGTGEGDVWEALWVDVEGGMQEGRPELAARSGCTWV